MQLYLGQSRIGWVSLPAIQEHPWDVRASLVRLVGVRCLTLGHYKSAVCLSSSGETKCIGVLRWVSVLPLLFCMSLCLCEGPAANNCLVVCIFSKKPDMSSVGSILTSSHASLTTFYGLYGDRALLVKSKTFPE